MARNGSGVYSLPVSYLATGGQAATATQHNEPLEDLRDDNNAQRPIVAGGTGAANASDARDNLGITERFDGTTAITPNLTAGSWEISGTAITPVAATFNKMQAVEDGSGQFVYYTGGGVLPQGYSLTDYNAGTKASGTFTPDPTNGNSQYAVNNGAHTLAPPSVSCNMVLDYTNGASAGTLTTSGFSVQTGDTFTTTNGDKFRLYISVGNAGSHLSVVAFQ